uniref:Uncharacterized protein n=1 Tax=Arthrobacter sp. Chr15 TaxID=447032 RepID=A6YFR1_9MICC|nr:unknown [Arthrobacter sp. Chr15]
MSTRRGAAAATAAATATRLPGSRAMGPRPSMSPAAARVNTPLPVSCHETGKNGIGASTKNPAPPAAARMRFQANGPTKAATAPAPHVAYRRPRTVSATSAPPATADMSAPSTI